MCAQTREEVPMTWWENYPDLEYCALLLIYLFIFCIFLYPSLHVKGSVGNALLHINKEECIQNINISKLLDKTFSSHPNKNWYNQQTVCIPFSDCRVEEERSFRPCIVTIINKCSKKFHMQFLKYKWKFSHI